MNPDPEKDQANPENIDIDLDSLAYSINQSSLVDKNIL
jgi:hypothetical protein